MRANPTGVVEKWIHIARERTSQDRRLAMRKFVEQPRRRVSLMPTTPVAEVMRRDVVCVPEDLTEGALMGVLLENDVAGAPVIDTGGYLIGYVSLSDVMRERYEAADTDEAVTVRTRHTAALGGGFHLEVMPPTVHDLMSPVAVEIMDSAHLDTAAALMAARHVNQLPVVDKDGHVVGILHAYDVLRWMSERGSPVVH
jgi:CBS domain-containing protein